jgi:streptogrisin C
MMIAATVPAMPAASAAQPAAAPAVAAIAPDPDRIETPAEALARDAAEYARRYGVTSDEAVHRLRAQQDSVTTVERLGAIYAARLAGIAIEHRPAYRVVFLLTGTEPVPDQLIYAGGMNLPIHFQTGATATEKQIVAAIAAHQGEIRAELPFAVGMGADARSGRLALLVTPADAKRYEPAQLQAEVEALAGVPARIEVIERREDNAALYGGSRVTGLLAATGKRAACTTGFVVTDGTRTGVLSAAHCPDQLSYHDLDGADLPLDLVGKWGTAYQDVQVSTAAQALMPLFRANPRGSDIRPLTGARSRAATRVGDFVCHSGIKSGYSCAEIEFTDYAPHPDVCGALCDPAWVTVAGPSCGKGDSGGPVFSGTVAFGITKGVSRSSDGNCGFYFYMSTDYLPTGWSLLREQTPPAATATASATAAAQLAP